LPAPEAKIHSGDLQNGAFLLPLSKTKNGPVTAYEETGVSEGSFARRHHFNSWLISEISIPGITMNLQLSIS
jgi:hypothetical protein